VLVTSQLHASLKEPVLGSINFLNEVIGRFPNAISFAPGAPNPDHLRDIDISAYVNRYVQHLCNNRGIRLDEAYRILYQYGPARGLINDLVADMLRHDKGINVPPNAIVITVGAQEAMLIVLRALFRSSCDRLAVVNPCFVGILGAARLLDIDVVGVNETEQGVDLDELDRLCISARLDNRNIRALYVAPDYSNPAGTVLSMEMRQRLLELARHHDFFLFEDNAYGFTATPENEIPSLKALDKTSRVIFLGTFAKVCLPGARVGYVVADQLVDDENGFSHLLADDLAMIKSMTTVNTSPICQALIGGMLLERGGSLAILEREKSLFYQSNLSLLLNALECRLFGNKEQSKGVSWNRPTGGFFVRVCLPIAADMALLEFSASHYGVLWTPMSPFYLNNGGLNELRLSCSYLTPEQIEEGIERFTNFIHSIT
jgi:(S)-3,5-dihydroxyphenylglycine transaminase